MLTETVDHRSTVYIGHWSTLEYTLRLARGGNAVAPYVDPYESHYYYIRIPFPTVGILSS